MNPIEVRDSILERLIEDIVGPHDKHETLNSRPLDVYLTGLLWPLETTIDADEDDGEFDDEDDRDAAKVAVFGQMKPSTMGVSFAINYSLENLFTAKYSFAAYCLIENANLKDKNELWQRIPFEGAVDIKLKDSRSFYIDIPTPGCNLNIKLHVRNKKHQNLRLITVTLVNASKLSDGSKIDGNQKSIFQTKIEIVVSEDSPLCGIPDEKVAIDEDEQSTALLYRSENSYAVGHQCSATWDRDTDVVKIVQSTWMPVELVRGFSQKGHSVFNKLNESGSLSAEFLANSQFSEVISSLENLNGCYANWISLQKQGIDNVPEDMRNIAMLHIKRCEETLLRMKSGVAKLNSDEFAFSAFQKANKAMSLQHSWKHPSEDIRSVLKWRPFQLAFWLLSLESICDSQSQDRETMDLLWFPTGGGKTEAYLAIIAFGSLYKRLKFPKTKDLPHNYAIMRYTLRLLTAQQFERASALILALELIRKEVNGNKQNLSLGNNKFSIGLWVGSDATPNTYKDAKSQKGADYGAIAEQIKKCFSCKSNLVWIYNDSLNSVRPSCANKECPLGKEFGIWPVLTVDEEIYKTRPSLLIGTVDKFAQITRRPEAKELFGFKSNLATELIIQDELHLISGPLGTIVGAYEVAFDWLLTHNGSKPKVIGSTATIRRANSQIKSLFNRSSSQFPPPGLNYEDSGFAVVDYQSPGRFYVGLSNAGRSAKFTLQAIAGSVLQSGGLDSVGDSHARDGYSTLLMYFNNLRELGGAIVQVLDDVPDSILLYSKFRNENPRNLGAPRELTSTRTQTEIIEILEDLSKSCESGEAVDVVLATNMVSVGVDVPRLGLMQVNGQPKTRSEYIQSTSRVGRSEYPGLVVVAHNVLRARDRSLFETFSTWHRRLYRDVEATSVTPFASRARDKTLKTILTTMVRHGIPGMLNTPNLENVDEDILLEIISVIEARVLNIDPDVSEEVSEEIKVALDEWASRDVSFYLDETPQGSRNSLLQSAERYAQKTAAGFIPGFAWPIMNAMRSVEPSTQFKLKEKKYVPNDFVSNIATDSGTENVDPDLPPWRR